jgi:hypothetical protein
MTQMERGPRESTPQPSGSDAQQSDARDTTPQRRSEQVSAFTFERRVRVLDALDPRVVAQLPAQLERDGASGPRVTDPHLARLNPNAARMLGANRLLQRCAVVDGGRR